MNENNIEFTNDKSLLSDPEYLIIKQILLDIYKTTNSQHFFGNCVASCDIIQNILSKNNINSRIVECQVSAIKEYSNNEKQYFFIGYDNHTYPGQIDTHTILITESTKPILIDVSIGYIFADTNNKNVIVEKLCSKNDSILSEYVFDNVTITYTNKKILRLPSVHQKNLMQRIVTEQNNEKSLNVLRIFIMIAVSLGVINFTMNALIIILRLFDIKLV